MRPEFDNVSKKYFGSQLSPAVFEGVSGPDGIERIGFCRGTKPLCCRSENRSQVLLCLVLGKHSPFHEKFPRGKCQDNFIIARIAKTLENVLPLSGSPIQREFHVAYRKDRSGLFGQNVTGVMVDVASFESVRDQQIRREVSGHPPQRKECLF